MGKAINFNFTFSEDQVRSIGECIVEELVESPILTSVFGTIETNVKNGKEIGFIKTDAGLMLRSGALGCTPTGSTFTSLSTSKKTWSPAAVYFRNEECETDTRQTFLDLSKKAGVDRYDMTDTEYYALVQLIVAKNLAKTVFVKAWFDDTAIDNVTGGGTLKDGVPVAALNTIDGLFKQLKVIYTATPARRVTISENAGASYAAQDAITDAACTKVFNDLLKKADVRLANADDKIYLATRSLVQGYRWDMQSKGTDTLMQKQLDGIEVPTCNGIPIIEIGVWDEAIRSYFDNGTKYDNPHRAILTTKAQLALAFQSDGAFERFDMHFDRTTKLNIIEGEDMYDAKVLEDHMVQIAI